MKCTRCNDIHSGIDTTHYFIINGIKHKFHKSCVKTEYLHGKG